MGGIVKSVAKVIGGAFGYKEPKVDTSAIREQEKRIAEQEARLAKQEGATAKRQMAARRSRTSGRSLLSEEYLGRQTTLGE